MEIYQHHEQISLSDTTFHEFFSLVFYALKCIWFGGIFNSVFLPLDEVVGILLIFPEIRMHKHHLICPPTDFPEPVHIQLHNPAFYLPNERGHF
jgi:hypothetical protein